METTTTSESDTSENSINASPDSDSTSRTVSATYESSITASPFTALITRSLPSTDEEDTMALLMADTSIDPL